MSQKLDITNDLIPRIATPFAGGMGRSGEVCGAVVGGIMSIGLVHGRNDSAQPVDEAMSLTRRFIAEFNQEMGNITCRDLTGMDLGTAEGLEKYYASDVRINVCLKAGGFAYDLVLRLLEKQEPG